MKTTQNNYMIKLLWIAMISLGMVLLVGCGGSSGSSPDTKAQAITKIKAYADSNGTSDAPGVEDYADAGVTGITAANLADMNQVVKNLTPKEVDTTAKLQALADALGREGESDTKPPTFTSPDSVSVPENQTAVVTLKATDDSGKPVTYGIKSSAGDAASFAVDAASGVVTFKHAPDYESGNILYTFTATATDTSGNSAEQNVTVHVTDINESNTSTSGWQSAVLLQTKATEPQISMAGNGKAFVVWRHFQNNRSNIVASKGNLDTNLSTPVLLEDSAHLNGYDAHFPQIASNANSNAMAIWRSTDYNIWVNHYTERSGWGAAEKINQTTIIDANHALTAWKPSIAIDDQGNAIAVWTQLYSSAPSYHSIHVRHYEPGSGWGAIQVIDRNSTTEDSRDKPLISMNSNGEAMVIWLRYDGVRNNVLVNHYTPANGWSGAENLENNDTEAYTPHISLSDNGSAVASWVQHDGSNRYLWTREYTSANGWGTPTKLSIVDATYTDHRTTMDSNGNAIIVWRKRHNTKLNVFGSYRSSGSSWSVPVQITARDDYALSPRVAMNANGNAIALWVQNTDDGKRALWVNHYSISTGWEGPVMIYVVDSNTQGVGDASIVIDNHDNAMIVWIHSSGANKEVWTRRYIAP